MVREKVAKTKAPSQLYTLMQLSIFCLQNEASFGISQLLNALNLANQNKSPPAQAKINKLAPKLHVNFHRNWQI